MGNWTFLFMCFAGCSVFCTGLLVPSSIKALNALYCTMGLTMAFFGVALFVIFEIKDAIKSKKPPNPATRKERDESLLYK